MSTLDHNFNNISKGPAENDAGKGKYPPPFSIRFTFEERARLDADRGPNALSSHIRELLFGDDVTPRKRPGNSPVGDAEALGRVLGALGASRLSANLNQLAKAVNTMRLALALNEKDALRKQLEDINRQLENMLDRIVEANSASVVNAYESRIEKLERDKLVLNDRITKSVPPKGRLDDCIELSLKFLSSPWNIWKNGDFAMRQAVLRLAFAEPLRYSQNGVYETPKFSFPFKCLGEFSGSKAKWCCEGGLNSRPRHYQ